MAEDCEGPLHPHARTGILLLNEGRFFESHEELETAWKDETGQARELYRGVLQAAVVYLHIRRGNYAGAVKVYARCRKWLDPWPAACRGIDVEQLRSDLEQAMAEVRRLGPTRLGDFGPELFKPVRMIENIRARNSKREYVCDRCGFRMFEKNCKVVCPNCGNRFDCSDLTLYFDD